MAGKGFAIQCPHCRKWNVWEDTHPKKIALDSLEHFDFIMDEFRVAKVKGQTDKFSNDKLLRCRRPRWSCPAPFEAFIFKKEETALECLGRAPEAWAISRDFRLFKADKKNRWDKERKEYYYCIMFCTEPVPRLEDIEFELLMDRKLVSRTILGVGYEIQAPLTVYAANIFEPEGKTPKVYWMPIEGYSLDREQLIPPKYNRFCYACREIVIKQLVKEFLEKKVSPGKCPLDGFGDGQNDMCAGKTAACLEQDWNHCPAFIEERKKRCPCYSSDFAAIERLRKMWKRGELTLDGLEHRHGVGYRCHAKFREWAFPIIVHGHLVGVAMTGQVFFDQREIVNLDEFINDWDDFKNTDSKYKLEKAKIVLLWEEEQHLSKGERATFLTNQEQFKERLEQLEPNVTKFEEMANVRYRDIRRRSEDAFRQEILAYVRRFKKASNFFEEPILDVLKRMREFWAFKAVGLLWHSSQTKDVSVVSYNSEITQDGFGFPGETIGHIDLSYPQRHPLHWLYDLGAPEAPLNLWVEQFLPLLEDAKKCLDLPKEGCFFFVVVPLGEEVCIFVFIARDNAIVSRSEQLTPESESVSELCQEFMLATCTEVSHELGDARAIGLD